MRWKCHAWCEDASLTSGRLLTKHHLLKLLLTVQAPKLSQDEQLALLIDRIMRYEVAGHIPLERAVLSEVFRRAQVYQVM